MRGQAEEEALWRTPTATAASRNNRDEPNLIDQARNGMWQTPTIFRGGSYHRSKDRKGELLLVGQAIDLTGGLQDQQRQSGETSSEMPLGSPQPSNTKLVLNPWFVEWLMGLPMGWVFRGPSS